ncbi:hypothetical protein lerEdw1_011431, partial [Lerista edwardsae]
PPPPPPPPPPNLLWWKITVGILLAGIAALTVVVIFLSLPGPPPPPPPPPPNLLWWKITVGILLAGIVALTVVVIFLSLPDSHNSFGKYSGDGIPSCLRRCIPCSSAKHSVTGKLSSAQYITDQEMCFAYLVVSKMSTMQKELQGMKHCVGKRSITFSQAQFL